jgi:hypothetical protein
MTTEELKQIHEKLADIYFDIVDLRRGEISDCYADQNELLDDLRDKFDNVLDYLPVPIV